MHSYFITSSGTEIGKTWVMRCLIAGFRAEGRSVRALKPIISGWDDAAPQETDTALILEALDMPLSQSAFDDISPWRFSAALSPDMAARRENRNVDFDALVAHCRSEQERAEDVLLVEGVGGAMVPLDESRTVLDWMGALGLPTILVVGSYLGTISHTLTAFAALRDRGLAVPVLVVNDTGDSPVPLEETKETLARFITGTPIVTLARRGDGHTNPEDGAKLIDHLI